ncbi:hypothetical protein L2X99_16470 [Microbacterium sp. KUDC0406]|uniref:hypothetical protein n=1 Tax=Microbacterium sp. KUDC0406 TaxID=2909588 RepID=UPI001F30BCB8|nr:hypothetical protein [Microbacterium sp. KUDC0406]UJP09939.1 hypothetical protein L2X99_16470 [Microbacterium sp. KUDC0406]
MIGAPAPRGPSAPHAPGRRWPAVLLAALVATGATGAFSGCAATPSDAQQARLAARAHGEAADFARDLYRGPTDTIDDYARWADERRAQHPSVELIGYEAYPGSVHGEPFGALRVRVTVTPQYDDPYAACFESEFDYWGVATEEFGGGMTMTRSPTRSTAQPTRSPWSRRSTPGRCRSFRTAPRPSSSMCSARRYRTPRRKGSSQR